MGDRVAAETYYQYAEHYYRIVNARADSRPNGDGQSGRRGGNGHAEAAREAAPEDGGEQPDPAAFNGEQPPEAPQAPQAPEAPQAQEAPQADDRQAPQRRRRPRQARPAEPQPDPQHEAQPSSEAEPTEDSEPAET